MKENVRKLFDEWLSDPYFDENTKQELLAIRNDEKEVEDRFYRDLEFGTGGLRGVIGAGTNRMNVYTVRKATQGLADYILQNNAQDKGVVISYDSRRFSPEFSMEAALCLAANGIRAYLFESLRPTPELSFAVRHLRATAGIMVTASHNPPEYNGYKVYWEDGAQITAPRDKEIIACVRNVTDFASVKTMDRSDAENRGLLTIIGDKIDDLYMEELKKQIVHPEIIKQTAGDLKIVYTPLHGTGLVPVKRILKELGFANVYVVPEQADPDPDFTTLAYPNPEDPAAFDLAIKLAKEKNADVVLATDPDADRLGIYALDTASGEYVPFTGNMSGMLIAEYLLREKTANGTMPQNPALVKTIVTTNMADVLAERYNITLIEVLTGFKYIGEQIKFFEEQGTYNYVFGLEESYGCLAGTHARDKDAVVAVMCLCEVAAWCKSKGITLWDQMLRLYEEYGTFREGLHTVTLKGMSGADQIRSIMQKLRTDPPTELAGIPVLRIRDYKSGEATDLSDGKKSALTLPASDVLYFDLKDNGWCCVRPSGTEPKIKFYMGVKSDNMEAADALLKELRSALVNLAEAAET
ncbi:MAG: phospho-sugar mutase [Lachnospiraceae bacterium]|nr:phospho-sugar mutase [Lachnospiraceae bacterium]